jgi:hypothetical protein
VEDETAKFVKALVDSEVAKRVYEDGALSAISEVGKLSGDLIKTVRLFTFPIQLLSTLQDRLAGALQRVREKVPEQRHQQAPPQIVGPIFEHLRYIPEGDVIAQMFEELLARSIDIERISEAHPSFVHIVSQLSRDEAVILHELRNVDFEVVDVMDYDPVENRFSNRTVESSTLPDHLLFHPKNVELYYSHLESLSLVQWPVTDQKPIKARNGVQVGVTRYSRMQLTDFGRLFVKACVPEEGFVE